MRVLVLGTGDFIVPTFEGLIASEHEVVALVTMPLRTKANARLSAPTGTRVRAIAFNAGIEIHEPDDINAQGAEWIRRTGADLLFVCDYGKILSREILAATRLGGLNLHGSLLPKYRGAAPIPRAILAGETTFGVSVIHLTPVVDAGPVLATAACAFTDTDTAIEIESRLAELGATKVFEVIRQLEKGTAAPIPQDDAAACGAAKLRKEEGRIDWSRGVTELIRQYRGMQPWPKTYSDWHCEAKPNGPPVRLILGPFAAVDSDIFPDQTDCTNQTAKFPPRTDKTDCAAAPGEKESSLKPPIIDGIGKTDCAAAPGTVVFASKDEILVRCGNGVVRVESIQPAGKRGMSAAEFLRGYRIAPGDQLR